MPLAFMQEVFLVIFAFVPITLMNTHPCQSRHCSRLPSAADRKHCQFSHNGILCQFYGNPIDFFVNTFFSAKSWKKSALLLNYHRSVVFEFFRNYRSTKLTDLAIACYLVFPMLNLLQSPINLVKYAA